MKANNKIRLVVRGSSLLLKQEAGRPKPLPRNRVFFILEGSLVFPEFFDNPSLALAKNAGDWAGMFLVHDRQPTLLFVDRMDQCGRPLSHNGFITFEKDGTFIVAPGHLKSLLPKARGKQDSHKRSFRDRHSR